MRMGRILRWLWHAIEWDAEQPLATCRRAIGNQSPIGRQRPNCPATGRDPITHLCSRRRVLVPFHVVLCIERA